MSPLPDIFSFDRYLFLLAHPDDELYAAALLGRLLALKKNVDIVYATSGDAKGMGNIRQQELAVSLGKIGVPPHQLHLLKVPERAILDELTTIIERTSSIATQVQAQCLVGHDYEGGHEAHDALAFCGATVAQKNQLSHIVYPLYHGKPQERKGARFIPDHANDQVEIPLSQAEEELKQEIIEIHASQAGHFNGLKRSAGDYLALLQSREVYRLVHPSYDFSSKPCEEVGYEFHRNGFKFGDFLKAIDRYEGN